MICTLFLKILVQYFKMGNSYISQNDGVIWNQSDFPLQYCVYQKFDQVVTSKTKRVINPNVDINVLDGSISLSGFQHISEVEINPKYQESFVEVQPGFHTGLGVRNLPMGECKIAIRLTLGSYVKYLTKGVVINSIKDVRIKIRNNWAFKDLTNNDIQYLEKTSLEISMLNPEKALSQSRQRQKYLQYKKELFDKILGELKKADK